MDILHSPEFDREKYNDYRDSVKDGDLVAFRGKGLFSRVICWKTRNEYSKKIGFTPSHVGLALWHNWLDMERLFIIESTSLLVKPDVLTKKRRSGVQMHMMSQRLDMYNGDAWLVPLVNPVPNPDAMKEWLFSKHSHETEYDLPGAIRGGIDIPFLGRWLFHADPDFSTLYCSEMWYRGLQVGETLPQDENASEKTPIDCMEREEVSDYPIRLKKAR